MKIRKGFVSNSSSSSFICDLTGSFESGWDAGLNDFNMVQCVNGHTFIFDGYPKVEEWVADSDANADSNYELPEELCPICNRSAKIILVNRLKKEMKNLRLTLEDFKDEDQTSQ